MKWGDCGGRSECYATHKAGHVEENLPFPSPPPPLLIGLGIEELSVAPVQLPSVKYAIRKLDAAHCHAMVEDCLRHGETERIAQRVHDTAMQFYPELLT